jgi:hypothetical protein
MEFVNPKTDACRARYLLRPASGRFGVRAPSVEKAVEALVLSNGATTANALGLTTQVPV